MLITPLNNGTLTLIVMFYVSVPIFRGVLLLFFVLF